MAAVSLQYGDSSAQMCDDIMEDEDETIQRQGTLAERELLMTPKLPKQSAFAPRSIQKLATKKAPRSMLNVECSHLLRCSYDEIAHGHHPVMYSMWIEAGKHTPPFPERADANYNANVWRNFRKSYGFHTRTQGQKVSEMIAQLYPLNMPPPSKVGEYSYPRFLSETPLIKDERLRKIAVERTTQDILEFKRVRLRSEMRNPPLDERGDIKPPVNFKRYAHRFVPPPEPEPEPEPETRLDMFGNRVPVLKNHRREPYLWKLSARLNQPEYEKVDAYKKQRDRELTERRHPPALAPRVMGGQARRVVAQ